jgi:hypothetical protein
MGMTLQAWHTCVWGVSPILLCRSSYALSGWLGSVAAQQLSLQRCLIGFTSGPWLGHSRTFRDLSRSHLCIALAVCLRLLPCWKDYRRPSLRSWALWGMFSSRIALHFAPFFFPSILTNIPVPVHPHSMMLPPPSFTVGMVLGFPQMWHLAIRRNSYILHFIFILWFHLYLTR